MSTVREALARTALLAPLSTDELDRLVEIGRIEYFPRDALVLEQGDVGPRLLVVLDGRAEVSRADGSGVARVLGDVGPGDVIGEMALLLDLPRSASVRALTELKCFTMDQVAYQEMVDASDPAALKLGMQIARTLASRLLLLNDRVLGLLAAADDEGLTLHDRFGVERQELYRLWS